MQHDEKWIVNACDNGKHDYDLATDYHEHMQRWRPMHETPMHHAIILIKSVDGEVSLCSYDPYYAEGGRGFTGGDGWILDPGGEERYLHHMKAAGWRPVHVGEN